jgi:hypothetical protein
MLFCLEPASFTMHFECATSSAANSVLVQQFTGHDWPSSLYNMSFDCSPDLSCDGNTCAGKSNPSWREVEDMHLPLQRCI